VKKKQKIKMVKIKMKSLNKKSSLGQEGWFLIIATIMFASFLLIKPILSAQAQEDKQAEASEESTILNIKKVIQDKQVELGQGGQGAQETRQAYLAQVKRVSAETLTVLSNDTNIVIPICENLEIIKDEKEIKLDQIAVDDWMLIYSILEENTPVVKRLVLTNKNFTQTERKIMLGSITELYSSNILFDSRCGESNLNFLLNSETQYFDINGDEISLKNLYPELQCLIVAKSKNNGQWQASSIKTLVDLDD